MKNRYSTNGFRSLNRISNSFFSLFSNRKDGNGISDGFLLSKLSSRSLALPMTSPAHAMAFSSMSTASTPSFFVPLLRVILASACFVSCVKCLSCLIINNNNTKKVKSKKKRRKITTKVYINKKKSISKNVQLKKKLVRVIRFESIFENRNN